MGRLIINNAISVNGAFEAPEPPPNGWLVLGPDDQADSLEMLQAAHALVMGRPVYEGLAAVWPQLAEVPGYETYAKRVNSMPKYVASRTLRGPLEWNATLLRGELVDSVSALKDEHDGDLVVTGCGELAHGLVAQGLVDEIKLWVSPYLWGKGPRIFDGVEPVRLDLISATTYSSGMVCLSYRPAPEESGGQASTSPTAG